MQTSWIHSRTISDGDKYEIKGLNIWAYDWKNTGQSIVVKDPLYGQTYSMNIYEIQQGSIKVKFAAGEFSNCVWGIYLEHED